MLHFLIDQMLDFHVAESLRNIGYDVIRTSDVGLATAPDTDVMKRAIQDGRILISLDEHFGDWAILPLDQHPGVIRLKVHPTTTKNVLSLLLANRIERKG